MKDNTASTRRWQAFVTRYNVYHNAKQAYDAGEQAQREGVRENFTERLPVFTVGYDKMRSLGRTQFETAITKCEKAIQLHSIKQKPKVNTNRRRTEKEKAFLARKEFNPFLKNAWLLMGRAQFQKGDFTAAASTFAYITRSYAAEPEVVAEARVWLARAYAELEWYYDADDALNRLGNAPLSSRLSRERDLTQATLLVRQSRLDEAVPYLQRAAKQVRNNQQQARLYYLLGQVLMELGRKDEAHKALQRCIGQHPNYAMAFNARILQTEALTTPRSASTMLRRLRSMAADGKNKDYLGQVYYAMGNIHLARRDTLAALEAYETGRAKDTQGGAERGVLLFRLGDLYWDRQRFDKAQPCYAEAIGLLEKESRGYAELTRRSQVLDALVPHTSTIFEQDSLLALVAMPERDRLAVVDRHIAEFKRQEAEARKSKADSARRAQDNGQGNLNNNMPQMPTPAMRNNDRSWYFYNTQLVQQGKQSFAKQWGNRRNADAWRRSNRSILAADQHAEVDYAADEALRQRIDAHRDSLAATGMSQAELDQHMARYVAQLEGSQGGAGLDNAPAAPADEATTDPRRREYYLANLPFTAEQQTAAHDLIQSALMEAALIEKDDLGDLALAKASLLRLVRNYPQFARLDEAYYHLFLIAKRQNLEAEAQQYRNILASSFPNYAMTSVVNDPEYDRNARYARELEDSLYAATYYAYLAGDGATVMRNFARSTKVYPDGANRPKFMLVHALARLNAVPRDTIAAELTTLATGFPKSDAAEMAGMIVRGLKEGRPITARRLDLGSLWTMREQERKVEAAVGAADREFSPEQNAPYVFLIVYPNGAIDDARLQFNLADFNFSAFLSRSLDLGKERVGAATHFAVSGFSSFAEVHQYAQRLFAERALVDQLRPAKTYLISVHNRKLIGTLKTLDDYRAYYDKHFAPIKINPALPLQLEPTEGGQPLQIYEDELPTTPAPAAPNQPQRDEPEKRKDYEEFDL